MAKRLRHGKAKQHPQSRKGRAKQRHAAMAAGQQAVSAVPPHSEPVATAMPSHPVSVRTTPAVPGRAHYTYITAELKRISILAGIMLAILIILALVLQ